MAPLPFDPIAEARRHWEQGWGHDLGCAAAGVLSIMRVQQILLTRLNELLRPLNLTLARYEALMLLTLSRRGSMPVGKLSERAQVHHTSMTDVADRLQLAGYATRVRHDVDRRSMLVEVTPAGREAAKRATAILTETRFAIDPIEPDRLDEVTQLLRPLRKSEGDFAP
jgi:DNA-binding MarR family transcriptional regulator